VAGSGPNHTNSALSSCEPLTVSPAAPTVSTVIKNAADDGTVTGPLPLGSSVYDTATLSDSGFPFTGTVTFRFFTTIDCSGEASTQSGVAVGAHSSNHGPLRAGSYSFNAQYIAGSDPNLPYSTLCSCEPLTVSAAAPTVSTVIKNAANDGTVTGALPLGSSVYDTASVTDSGFAFTGTVTFRFFSSIDCSGEASTQSGVAVGAHSSTHGPLAAGSYSFNAQYIAGSDPNHTNSALSSCEPLTVSAAPPSDSPAIKNAADDLTVTEPLPLGSSVYDTASVSDSGFPFTGTVTF